MKLKMKHECIDQSTIKPWQEWIVLPYEENSSTVEICSKYHMDLSEGSKSSCDTLAHIEEVLVEPMFCRSSGLPIASKGRRGNLDDLAVHAQIKLTATALVNRDVFLTCQGLQTIDGRHPLSRRLASRTRDGSVLWKVFERTGVAHCGRSARFRFFVGSAQPKIDLCQSIQHVERRYHLCNDHFLSARANSLTQERSAKGRAPLLFFINYSE